MYADYKSPHSPIQYCPAAGGNTLAVREDSVWYEPRPNLEREGSVRRTLASIDIASNAWWTGTIVVPFSPGNVVFLSIERHGQVPKGYLGSQEAADFSVPIGEIEAVMTVLAGLVADARKHGVL